MDKMSYIKIRFLNIDLVLISSVWVICNFFTCALLTSSAFVSYSLFVLQGYLRVKPNRSEIFGLKPEVLSVVFFTTLFIMYLKADGTTDFCLVST